MEILVLGNGISRLAYDETIRNWPGEVWGCNLAYLDYPGKLTRLTGHKEELINAAAEREKHEGWNFELWAGNLANTIKDVHRFTCPKQFQHDSGTTLIAQALYEGHNVAACGFDLGGPDIHSPELENVPKWNWVDRWRALLAEYGADRVRFIGHDHMPFLLGDQPSDAYCHRYLHGRPHIADPEYIEIWEQFTGRSAVDIQEEIMIEVRFPDGRKVIMKDFIAEKMAKKGKVEIVGKVKDEKPKAEKPKEKEAEKAKAAK
jgi:hypothetical protein